MANYEATIADFVVGDALTIERTITAIPSGQTLSNAWFTVKRAYSDSDVSAIIQKAITPILSSTGQIDDTGADGTGHVVFYLTGSDTALLTALSEYKYDIQVKLSGGNISTPELGIITAFPQVTRTA